MNEQNPSAPPVPPANLRPGIAPIDVSKGVRVNPQTGEIELADPNLSNQPGKPVTSQTIEQPAPAGPGVADSTQAGFEGRLATEQARNTSGQLAEQVPAEGVTVGTPEQNMPQEGELAQGSRIVNPRQISEPARPNLQSGSEQVRDIASGQRRQMPFSPAAALEEVGQRRVKRIVDIAAGREKGITGEYGEKYGLVSPLLDATLEAVSIPGDVAGDMLAKQLVAAGMDPQTAETLGMAARVVGGLYYGAKAPLGLGVPGAITRYAREIGLLKQAKTANEMRQVMTGFLGGERTASQLVGNDITSANDIFTMVKGKPESQMAAAARLARGFREYQYENAVNKMEEGLKATGGATVNVNTGHVAVGPEEAVVSVVPGRSKVIEGDATKEDLRAFAKANRDLTDAYPELSLGAWKDQETGRTHLDLSVKTTPEHAFELGKVNRQKSIYLGTGETPRVPHTYSIEEGAKGHGYVPTERMRPEDVFVAKQYDAAPVMDPEAVPAWRDLMAHVRQDVELNILPKLNVEEVHGQPYANAAEMNADIANGHLKVSVDNSEHPVWTPQENILFRIWHDYRQHFENGADFSLEGEWKAFKRAEEGMPAAARDALHVEIYGQAAAATAHSGEFQVQKIYLPGKKYSAKDTLAEQLAGLRREQVTAPHSAIADTLEAHAASVLADTPQGTPVFHGAPVAFEKADMGVGLWVAEDPATANRYTKPKPHVDIPAEQQAGNVRPYYLDPAAKLADESLVDEMVGRGLEADQILDELVHQGYDGVAFSGDVTGKGRHYWVFNPNALTEKFTGRTAATLAMIAGAGAAAHAAAGDEDSGTSPLAAGIAAASVMRGKKASLARAEKLAKDAQGTLRYLTRAVDWTKVSKNSKEVSALAAVGASMFARGEVTTPVELMARLADRFGPAVLQHSDVIPKKATAWFEDTLKNIDLRPVEEVIGYFKDAKELPDWYASGERVRQVFGPDADLVAGLIAATSAKNANFKSVNAALHIYAAGKTGKFDPKDAASIRSWLQAEAKANPDFGYWAMSTHYNNVERAFLGQEISGNKVWNYKRAILGDENAVVIDSHMVKTLLPDMAKIREMEAAGQRVPDWVLEGSGDERKVISNPDLSKDFIYQYFEDQVRDMAKAQGVTPRFMQQAIWVGKVMAEGAVEGSAQPLLEMFADLARQQGVERFFPGIANKNLTSLGIAGGLVAAASQAEQAGGVQPDHIEASFGSMLGTNERMMKLLTQAVRALRGLPGHVKEIPPTAAAQALDILTAPKSIIKAGDKLLGMDWVGMARDADALPNTIKTVREAFEAELKADSRGVVSHRMERELAQTLTELGYDPAVAVAKWKEGDRSVVSTEIMATAALTKQAYLELRRVADLATRLEGTEAGARALNDYGRQLGVFAALTSTLDGMGEEAGRALGVFRALVPDIPPEARAFARREFGLAERGLSPMGGPVAEAATADAKAAGKAGPSVAAQAAPGTAQAPGAGAGMGAAGKSAGSGAASTRGGAFQGPPGPQAVLAAGNAAIANAQQMQAQYLTTLLQAWNQLPRSAQQAQFVREVMRWGLDMVKEAFYNSMLWTFTGQVANNLGNLIGTTGEQMSRLLSVGIGAVRHDILGLGPEGMSMQQLTSGSFNGAMNSVLEAFVAAGKSWWTGVPQSRGIMGASVTKSPYALTGERIQDLMALQGVQIPNAVYHGINVLGASLGAGSRAMLAGDEWWKVINYRAEIQRLGIATAERQGLKGQALSNFMTAYLQNPPAEDVKAARDYAHYVTYTSPLSGTLANISKLGHSTLMTPFTPFFDTLANVGKYELEWIPGLNYLVTKSREDLAHMGPRQDQALAKLAVGSTMLAGAVQLYFAGHLSGPGPSDKKVLRNMVELEKYQPWSFVFTDSNGKKQYIGINRADPANFPFLFAAAYGDIALEALDGRAVSKDTLAELALAGAQAISEIAMTRNYAEGFANVVELVTAKDITTFNKLQKMGQRMAGQMIPTALYQVNKEVDPYQRAVYSALDQVYSRLPGKSTQLMPDVDMAGRDRFKTAALGPDWISPFPYSEQDLDVVGQELRKNGVSLDKPPQSIFGPPPPPIVGEDKPENGIVLNEKQHYLFKKLCGNDLKVPTSNFEPMLRSFGFKGELPEGKMGMWDMLTAFVKTRTYQMLEPAMKRDVLAGIISGYRQAAMGEMVRRDKDVRQKFFAKVVDRAELFGGPKMRAVAEHAIKTMTVDDVLEMTGNQ